MSWDAAVQRQRRTEGRCYSCGHELTDEHKLCGDCRAYHRNRKRQVRAERRDAGLCLSCAAPAPGQYCEACKARQRVRQQVAAKKRKATREAARAKAQRRHARGLCWRCQNPTVGGAWLCPSCAKRNSAEVVERLRERSDEGLCRCGREPRPGFTLCEGCAVTRRAQMNRLRKARIEAGICAECRSPRTDNTYCDEHRARHRANDARRWRRKAALKRAGIARVA